MSREICVDFRAPLHRVSECIKTHRSPRRIFAISLIHDAGAQVVVGAVNVAARCANHATLNSVQGRNGHSKNRRYLKLSWM